MLRPASKADAEGMAVPRFALIEAQAPDLRAVILSPIILATLLSGTMVLAHLPGVTHAPIAEDVTLLVAPPEPLAMPDLSAMKAESKIVSAVPPDAEPTDVDPPAPEPPEPKPAPIAEPVAPAAMPAPPPIVEKPQPIPAPPVRTLASTAPAPAPAVMAVTQPEPAATPAALVRNVAANEHKPEPAAFDPGRDAVPNIPKSVPASLGGLPLSQLIDDQDGLAAGLAALPSIERRNLPRVSIRVNAEWLEALPKTQERLYFSITTPQPDREVLAYLPGSHSFDLERPEHPLWKIHDGERVPALAELRAEAGRWLGVSPELVGLYTWHPPVFEDALQMFVLERMQELRVQLGPRDIVTVRLAPGSGGTVMNLEPIRQDASSN
jgi:hypothetical protein